MNVAELNKRLALEPYGLKPEEVDIVFQDDISNYSISNVRLVVEPGAKKAVVQVRIENDYLKSIK